MRPGITPAVFVNITNMAYLPQVSNKPKETAVLSQEEIDELLSAINADISDEDELPDFSESALDDDPRMRLSKAFSKIEFSFKEMATINPQMAQEMQNNLTSLRKEINGIVDIQNKWFVTLKKEHDLINKELKRLRDILKGSELF